jgi:hypothetical protein
MRRNLGPPIHRVRNSHHRQVSLCLVATWRLGERLMRNRNAPLLVGLRSKTSLAASRLSECGKFASMSADGAILNAGIRSGILRHHEESAQDHRRSAGETSRKGTTRQRWRHHSDRSYRPRVGCRFAGQCPTAPTPGQDPFHTRSGTEGRSMIAVDAGTWIGFLQGDRGPRICSTSPRLAVPPVCP